MTGTETETATGTMTETGTYTPTGTETATATGTYTPTPTGRPSVTPLPPEPDWSLAYTQNFQTGGDPFSEFIGVFGLPHTGNGYALALTELAPPVLFNQTLSASFAFETTLIFSQGSAHLSFTGADGSGYEVVLQADGLVILSRNGQPVASSTIVFSGQHRLWLSLRNATVQLRLDGTDVILFQDPSPLSVIQLQFSTDGSGEHGLWIDDVNYSLPYAPAADAPVGLSAILSSPNHLFLNQPQLYTSHFDVRELNNRLVGEGILASKQTPAGGLFAVNRLGEELELSIAGNSTYTAFFFPSVSPNGEWLAVQCYSGSLNRYDICITNLTGSPGAVMFNVTSDNYYDYSPAWSSDGTSLALIQKIGFGSVVRIYSINTQTQTATQQTLPGSIPCDHSLNYAGAVLICANSSGDILAVDLTDMSWQTLADLPGASPVPILDVRPALGEASNAFELVYADSGEYAFTLQPFTVNSDHTVNLLTAETFETDEFIHDLVFSPDDETIAYVGRVATADYGVYLYDYWLDNKTRITDPFDPPLTMKLTWLEAEFLLTLSDQATATAQAQPTATYTVTPAYCTAAVIPNPPAALVNIRSAPNTLSPQIGYTQSGDVLDVFGRNYESSWYFVRNYRPIGGSATPEFVTEPPGWVNSAIIDVSACNSVPIVDDIGRTATPTTTQPPIPTLTPSLTPPPLPNGVASQAVEFYQSYREFGLPPPLDAFPYAGADSVGRLRGQPLSIQGYGPTTFAYTWQDEYYENTAGIHPGLDFGLGGVWDNEIVLSVCDGIVIGNRDNLLLGTTAAGSGVVVRCFMDSLGYLEDANASNNIRVDTDLDGRPNLSNLLVSYGHLNGNQGNLFVTMGQVVRVGDQLGVTDADATNPYDHLHLEVFLRRGFRYTETEHAVMINPMLVFSQRVTDAWLGENAPQSYHPEPLLGLPASPQTGILPGQLDYWSLGGLNGNEMSQSTSNFWDAQDASDTLVEWPISVYVRSRTEQPEAVYALPQYLFFNYNYAYFPYQPSNCAIQGNQIIPQECE
jgi:WD40 repeat protein/murein DD-endopeptidase MepM/ murein hydrolase activator NlpD